MSSDDRGQCPGELEIAAYLAGTTSAEQKRRLEEHFADCARCCRELAELIRLETPSEQKMDAAAQARIWNRIEAAVVALREKGGPEDEPGEAATRDIATRPPNVITLHFRPPSVVASKSYALAAATEDVEIPSTLTFAAEDGSILAKLMRDDATGETSVYLITEHMDRLQGVLLTLECTAADYSFQGSPDADGVVLLGAAPVLPPDETRVELRFPTGSFPLRSET